jgi:serine/threonine protein kinase
LPLAPSFDAADDSAISDAVIAPSLSKDQDVSGDWSDAGMSFTNERMKMAPNTGSIPNHVTSHGSKFFGEEHEEIDTVMEEGDAELDDADTKIHSEDDVKMPAMGSSETTAGTKLNFNALSSPQSSELPHTTIEQTGNQSTLETTLHPHTPRSLGAEQFHIHNLEVSPIIRLPEDDDVRLDDGDIPMKGSLDEDESFKERIDVGDHRTRLQHLFRGSPSPSSNFDKDMEANTSAASSTSAFTAGSATAASASTANVNNTTILSNVSSTSRPQTRKIRPMPDTSAFDVCTPSQQSLGSKDSGQTSHKTSASDRLLCPPTPIRTPAWAHAEGRPTFQRANSLISTKVLAACPPRVLDSLSSLEDSMLENDISGSTMDPDSHPMLNSSFAPLEEKDEDDLFEDDCMFRPLSENFDEQGSPLRDPSLARKVTNLNPKQGGASEETTATQSRFSVGGSDLSSIVSFSSDFDNLGILGSGAFADVYKVRSKRDQVCYAIKHTRRQFRGVRDRERAMSEVQTMQRLQVALESASTSSAHDKSHAGAVSHSKSSYGLYLLFFIRAWQEDGYFFCQTELCCRATCRQLRLSLTSDWTRDVSRYPSLLTCLEPSEDRDELKRLLPERAIWQICHDISRGLFHIHSHGMVHYDIKPSNIFFVYNVRWGTICKIGDFGLAGDIGTTDDGQEGDTVYMANELLSSSVKHPGADIFSLGLTLYELAAAATWSLPREGERWHDLRSGAHIPDTPTSRSPSLRMLIQTMLRPDAKERPSAEDVSEHADVKRASAMSNSFLSQYVKDVQQYDSVQERELETAEREARRR